MLRINPFLKSIFSISRGFNGVNLGMLEGEFDVFGEGYLTFAYKEFIGIRGRDFGFGFC